jgi:hypothetical protein
MAKAALYGAAFCYWLTFTPENDSQENQCHAAEAVLIPHIHLNSDLRQLLPTADGKRWHSLLAHQFVQRWDIDAHNLLPARQLGVQA